MATAACQFAAFLALLLCACAAPACAHLATANVTYMVGGSPFEGYTAYNSDGAAAGVKFPVVLIVHQWAGLGPLEKLRAEEFGRLGYFAFAIDLYGAGIRPVTTTDRSSYSSLLTSNASLVIERAQGALEFAGNFTRADTRNVSAVGICLGGRLVLEMARAGMPLKVAAAWHPGATVSTLSAELKRDLTASVLVVQGLSDSALANADASWTLLDELRASDADWQWRALSNTLHGFTDPYDSTRYNALSTLRTKWLTYQLLEEKMPTGRPSPQWGSILADADALGPYIPTLRDETVLSSDAEPVPLEGWVAEPSQLEQLTNVTGPRPGVLILPSMHGIGDTEKKWAEVLATNGYITYVGDIYGNGLQPDNDPDRYANAMSWLMNPVAGRQRVSDSLNYLLGRADVSKVAVLGFCFGGIMAGELARSGAQVALTMALHPGNLSSSLPTPVGAFSGSWFVSEGADDELFTSEQMQAWFTEIKGQNGTADAQLHVLGNTMHAYTEPLANYTNAMYSQQATDRSFREVLAMLGRDLPVPAVLTSSPPPPPPPYVHSPPPPVRSPPPPPMASSPPPPSSGAAGALQSLFTGVLASVLVAVLMAI
eukprot:jgi/Mesvir1/21057/Mv16546-RA.1